MICDDISIIFEALLYEIQKKWTRNYTKTKIESLKLKGK